TPVHLGSGMVKCAHGLIPVPAPATALLLKGYQVVIDTDTPFELTTPTGAAILKGLKAQPLASENLAYDKVGHGLGSREIGRPNFLRAFLTSSQAKKKADLIVEFSTNLDNVSGELLGHAASQIMAAGALDFTIVAATMKKGRPGHVLTVIATPENAEAVEKAIFDELPTLGLRKATIERTVLDRREIEIETTAGKVRAKEITEIDGSKRTTIEFGERARIAAQNHCTVRTLNFD
ncbi:MAG: LarC family nickel insertion protein, partial [Candidatus Riflebacteria bacterium]